MAWVMARMWASVNVPLQRRAAMAAGAELDALIGVGQIGLALVVFPFEPGDIDEKFLRSRFASQGAQRHVILLPER